MLAVVLPRDDHVFYSERVNNLKITDPEFVNFDISESPITKHLPKLEGSRVIKDLRYLARGLLKGVDEELEKWAEEQASENQNLRGQINEK